AAGARVELIEDGKVSAIPGDRAIASNDQTLAFDWPGDGARHWRRVNVRGADGKLVLIGNPVYVTP
ncbi:MAG TPA: PHP domain-containing protein, partial [Tahibacter sp.]|nr:PHP domain-containing protein [Tahibacter sp.]